ncbi:MAG: hypothetical protein WD355_03395, partial [Balneolaceae bacterium]
MKDNRKWNRRSALLALIAVTAMSTAAFSQESGESAPATGERLQVLFLGDDQGHEPVVRLRDITRPMLDRGIELFYTSDLGDINLENLSRYDAVLHYANYHEPHYPETDPDVIRALRTYVES